MDPTVALLPAGETIEDWLEPLGLGLEDLRDEMTGGWIFGYVDALRTTGVSTVLVCVSRSVDRPIRFVHAPTGSILWALPRPRANALLHRAATRVLAYDATDAPIWRRVLRSPMRHLAWLLSTPPAHLAFVLRREECSAVVCQDYEQPRFDACVLLGRLLRVPVFGSFQGADRALSPLERPMRRWTIRASAGLVAGPQREVQRVRRRYGLGADRVVQIFNPLDLQPWTIADRGRARAALGIEPDAGVVVWHGRVERHTKGLDILLDAWAGVCERMTDKHPLLLLVGSGRDARAVADDIAGRGLTGVRRIDEYVVDRQRLADHLAAGDVYVFPSRTEGFPVAPVEAMACGLPVVAADAAGIADILEEGESSGGLVVPVGDPQALAAALVELLSDPGRAARLGELARQRVEEAFSLEAVGGQLRSFLLGPAACL